MAEPAPGSAPATFDGSNWCGGPFSHGNETLNVYAKSPGTSCKFAMAVATKFLSSDPYPDTLTATSPVTGKSYDMVCENETDMAGGVCMEPGNESVMVEIVDVPKTLRDRANS